jgi:hypothetical protein
LASNAQGEREKRPRVVDTRYWYRLSLDTVRGWVIFFGLLGLLALGVISYRYLQEMSMERKAAIIIDEAELMLTRVQTEAGRGANSGIYNEAWQNLQQARRELAAGDFSGSLVSARWSRNLFSSLLDDLRSKAPGGEAQFVDVHGGVEFRRGDGPWQVARSRIVLRSGDYVKTARNGSAEVSFTDGAVFRVRPDTVVLISRNRTESGTPTEDAVSLEYGWIDLDTSSRGGKVRTPEAEATIASDSRVGFAYDRERRASRFSSYQGTMEIRTRIGTLRRLGTMEQFTMTAAGLSANVSLPPSPSLEWPDADTDFELADAEVTLRWKRVDGAPRYALQISRDAHFIDNVIDVEDRVSSSARVGFLEEGEFLWRVAAFSRQGFKGPWSEPQAFRVLGEATPDRTDEQRGDAG